MLSKRASLGLRVVTIIASAPGHRTINADSLASLTGVSLSYIEGILKDAREFGLIQSTRGPGGGYQSIASLRGLSVWSVIECFTPPKPLAHNDHSSKEWQATNTIAEVLQMGSSGMKRGNATASRTRCTRGAEGEAMIGRT